MTWTAASAKKRAATIANKKAFINAAKNGTLDLSSRGEEKKPISCIDEAKEIIYGDREKVYGHPAKNLNTICRLWRAYLMARPQPINLTSEDVAIMLLLLKVAREANERKRDNIVDMIGYAALIDRLGEGG